MSLLHPLDGDGAAFNLFFYLSKKRSGLEDRPLRFRIPDTIIFHNFPTAWYYWVPLPKVDTGPSSSSAAAAAGGDTASRSGESIADLSGALEGGPQSPGTPGGMTARGGTEKKQREQQPQPQGAQQPQEPVYGEIRRKGGRHLAKANIMKQFRRNESRCDIVGSFISKDSPGDQACSVQFFRAAELDEFLNHQHTGILQAFVVPSQARNEVLQAVWSPQVCHVNKLVNRHRLKDFGRSAYDRAVTYEGPTHLSECVFLAPRTAQKVRDVCESLVEQFNSVEHHYTISRMVVYLKEGLGLNDMLWLTFSSSIRVVEVRFKEPKPPLSMIPQFKTEPFHLEVPDDPLLPPVEAARLRSPKPRGPSASELSEEKLEEVAQSTVQLLEDSDDLLLDPVTRRRIVGVLDDELGLIRRQRTLLPSTGP
eukprot:RCo000825